MRLQFVSDEDGPVGVVEFRADGTADVVSATPDRLWAKK
jgi:hypothetical protein